MVPIEAVVPIEEETHEAAKPTEFEEGAEPRNEIADLRRFMPSTAMGGAGKKPSGKKHRAR